MNKRGVSRSMMIAGEIVAAALVAFILFSNVAKCSNTETIYGNYLAEDIALTIDSVFAGTGNVIVNYTGKLSDYSVGLEDNSVLLKHERGFIENKKKIVPLKGYYIPEKPLSNLKGLKIAKIGKEIYFDEQLDVNMDILSCNKVQDNGKTKIILDLNPNKKDSKPSDEICSLANSFLIKLGSPAFFLGTVSTRKIYDDTHLINCNDELYEYPEEKEGIIISMKEGEAKNNINFVKAFIISGSKKESNSRALACMMLNSIITNKNLKEIKIDGISIVPVDIETKGNDFPKGFFPDEISEFDGIFVMLEIGNVNTESGKEPLRESSYIGESIAEALIKYKS
ncbi:MAG: hypothetical protein PHV16_01270 [Candidatus Nanoarchaeia archaeon]|nr:hypothetical protein [Candidatus Nanoarchaeia archaeon]